MYVTKFLSHYKSSPEALSLPPEGPNTGYLEIQDQESETYSCFGLCKNHDLEAFPFPQNKILTTRYESGSSQHRHVSYNKVVLIPVLNQPLSSNHYYAIQPRGSHKGEAFACSKEEDMATCCFCRCVRDVKPRPLNPQDIYQQFQIFPYDPYICKTNGYFRAKSLAPDAFPPDFLRRKGWQLYTKTPKNYTLHEAKGINPSLRAQLPGLKTSQPVIVGKWYCPFMFIKEGSLAYQVKNSIFYEMTLERKWERIFEHENERNNGGHASVKADVESEAVFLGANGHKATWDERNVVNGAIWFTSNGQEERVGLGLEVFERMKWEEERVGWISGGEKKKKIEDKFEGVGEWRKFSCYVLVERFVLKRMDGSLVLAYDFKHAHQIKTLFE